MSYVPYQLDYKVTGAGKTLGVTKKKVIWNFGFANDKALSEGASGPNCRGSEHEIVFTWSLKSGKRQIAVDGKEVHFSESGMNGWTSDRTFQHHFNIYNPTYGSIRCHLMTLPPNRDAPGGNRPFQLRVYGVNFFDFSQIFQLGTPAMVVRPAPSGSGPRSPDDDPNMSPEERQAVARAKLESMRDLRKVNSKDSDDLASPRGQETSLISFDDPPPPQGVQTGGGYGRSMMSSMTMNRSYDSLSPQQQGAPAPAPYSNYALAAAAAAPAYGQQPAYGAPAPAYGQPPAAPAYNAPYGAPAPASYGAQPPAQAGYGFAQAPAPVDAPTYGAPAPAYGAPAPQGSWGAPPAAPAPAYGNYSQNHQQPAGLSVQTSGAAPVPAYASTTPLSYGSAPSFAQPPQHQQQTPAFASPPQQHYGGY